MRTSSLGAYISLGVMEHFEDGCAAAMAEAFRVLKPGGLMFFTVPLENPFRKLFAHPSEMPTWPGAGAGETISTLPNIAIPDRKLKTF